MLNTLVASATEIEPEFIKFAIRKSVGQHDLLASFTVKSARS